MFSTPPAVGAIMMLVAVIFVVILMAGIMIMIRNRRGKCFNLDFLTVVPVLLYSFKGLCPSSNLYINPFQQLNSCLTSLSHF